MPNSETFSVGPIGDFVRKYLHDSRISFDLFSRNKRWATYTNDLNPETSATYHFEAAEFLEWAKNLGVKPDLVIFDPPYSLEQCSRSYKDAGRVVTQQYANI